MNSSNIIVPERWTPLRYHKTQVECFNSTARFNIVHSGRRSGKTELIGKRKIVMKALRGSQQTPDYKSFVAAPVRHQAKKIYWNDLKTLTPKWAIYGKPNESELIIQLINGSEIHVLGMDRPERVEGIPWNHGLLDEFGNMKSRVWEEHVRPALSDRMGSCDFIGVPEGRNHYYDLAEKAKQRSDWAVWHWPSWEILSPEEVDNAKDIMDDIIFDQEYGGQFVLFAGAVYYSFNEKLHVGRYAHLYDPQRPLVFCFDFNVSPGVAAVIQEYDNEVFDIPNGQSVTAVIGEVHIPRNSNTVRVCRRLISDWAQYHKGIVICYGDATGGAKGTAKIKGNDWDLIRQMMMPHFGDRLYVKVGKSNPRERQRVNAVNSRLLSHNGLIRLVIDGHKAPNVVKDFEGVRVIEGTAGEIDKTRDTALTHVSDAIGYYIHKEFPVGRFYTREDILAVMDENEKRKRESMARQTEALSLA